MLFQRCISGNGWRLRPETDTDAGFLESLFCSVRRDDPMLAAWPSEQRQVFLRQQFLAQYRHYRSNYGELGEFLIIEDPTLPEPVGRLCLHHAVDQIRIVDIALLPQWQGQGIGAALLHMIMEEAGIRGVGVGLHVDAYNPARRLYCRLGFVEQHVNGPYIFMSWIADGNGPEQRALAQGLQASDRCQPQA